MKVVIVGIKNGKRRIMWRNYFVLGFVLCLTLGLGMGAVFRLLSGYWNNLVVFYGVLLGTGIIAYGLWSGLQTPLEELTKVD